MKLKMNLIKIIKFKENWCKGLAHEFPKFKV